MKNLSKVLTFLSIALITLSACKKDIEEQVDPIVLDCYSYSEEGSYNLENRGSGIDYTIDCKMHIYGDLTIEPGVVIQFTNDAGLEIHSTGSLSAVGSSDNKIEFIGKDDQNGSWLGILFDTDDIKNQLTHCIVKNAGGNAFNSNDDKGALIIWADTKLNVNNCQFINSAEYGINANYGGSKLTFTDNIISGCNMPMLLNAEYVGSITNGTYSGNTTDVIYIATYAGNGNIESAQTWRDWGVNYRVKTGGPIQVIDVNLSIAEGVNIEFETGTGINVTKHASFSAIGTSAAPILFTGVVKQAGSWESIAFNFTNSPLNEIAHAKIEYAGENSANGAIYMWADPDLKISNVDFSNIEACAFYDAPKPDYDPASQTVNPNLNFSNISYVAVENQSGSTIESGNSAYCYGG